MKISKVVAVMAAVVLTAGLAFGQDKGGTVLVTTSSNVSTSAVKIATAHSGRVAFFVWNSAGTETNKLSLSSATYANSFYPGAILPSASWPTNGAPIDANVSTHYRGDVYAIGNTANVTNTFIVIEILTP